VDAAIDDPDVERPELVTGRLADLASEQALQGGVGGRVGTGLDDDGGVRGRGLR
jgi:hypothetical protein